MEVKVIVSWPGQHQSNLAFQTCILLLWLLRKSMAHTAVCSYLHWAVYFISFYCHIRCFGYKLSHVAPESANVWLLHELKGLQMFVCKCQQQSCKLWGFWSLWNYFMIRTLSRTRPPTHWKTLQYSTCEQKAACTPGLTPGWTSSGSAFGYVNMCTHRTVCQYNITNQSAERSPEYDNVINIMNIINPSKAIRDVSSSVLLGFFCRKTNKIMKTSEGLLKKNH